VTLSNDILEEISSQAIPLSSPSRLPFGFGVTFFFGLKYAPFIGDDFAIIPAERGHPSSYLHFQCHPSSL